jgi:hypothetical protein
LLLAVWARGRLSRSMSREGREKDELDVDFLRVLRFC